MLGADGLGGFEPFEGVGRWHPNVDDDDVGLLLADQGEEFDRVSGLADHVEAGFAQQGGDALAEQDGVIGE